MRIVIDLQGAQASNRMRGIGRYALSLSRALARNRGIHDIHLALSDLFPDTIAPLKAAFIDALPTKNIHVWVCEAPVAAIDIANDSRRMVSEAMREAFLASLRPDIVLITSLFEGLGDDAILSIGQLTNLPTAVVLYDLIPLIHASIYLKEPRVDAWYREKLEHLHRADFILAISESTRLESQKWLGFPVQDSVNISSGCDTHFTKREYSPTEQTVLRQKYGLNRHFVMYTGGIDHRKNLDTLIRAYALLPARLRASHQLAVVCSINIQSKYRYTTLAREVGLTEDELVMTDFVPEDDLIALYNTCTLFVFPSWHEGFGLPVLEAMRCGKAVLAANTTSLPEVVGHPDALFDPHDKTDIAAKLEEALTNPAFREMLERHGLVQAQLFDWDDTARRAITALEQWLERTNTTRIKASSHMTNKAEVLRPRLAYVSPLPPERSGISFYSAELLRELVRWYEVEVIVDQDEVDDTWIREHCIIRSPAWLREHQNDYARVLYHFGNSSFHQHMFSLLEDIPGVIVLHDFFLSGIQAHREAHGLAQHSWARALLTSHGYRAVKERFTAQDTADVVWTYPANLPTVQDALGVIVHSENARNLAAYWYGVEADWPIIPLLRTPSTEPNRRKSRESLGLKIDSTLVCSFGLLGSAKLNHRLLSAFLGSSLAADTKTELVFVGGNEHSDYGRQLLENIRRSGLKNRIRVTGWVDTDTFRTYLAAADICVQLRCFSRGETSATVLDCMNYGIATIVNANGSAAELDVAGVKLLPDEFSDRELIEALQELWQDQEKRLALGERAKRIVHERHAPAACAKRYAEAIEDIYKENRNTVGGLTKNPCVQSLSDNEQLCLAQLMAQNFPPTTRPRQLLVDISELILRDAQSGIQRVVKSVLQEWLDNPPHGFQVEPVYATQNASGYFYARQFTCDFLGIPSHWTQDEPVDIWPGDIFFGLDFQPLIQTSMSEYYQALRRRGITVLFLVYDLLCIQQPQHFFPGAAENFSNWLKVVGECDGAVCISKVTAENLASWIQTELSERHPSFKISWFHIGTDINSSAPSIDLPPCADTVLSSLKKRPSFLMVGTIEPRKGHEQILNTFEELWRSSLDVGLVIVGKQGWMVDALMHRLRNHQELNKRIFLLEGISDEYLEKVYAACACLIAASYGEGFGLPLIEAARHNLPIMARDIPVFREVAQDYAYYFAGQNTEELAYAVKDWLTLARNELAPSSSSMAWLTWQVSASDLMQRILTMHQGVVRA